MPKETKPTERTSVQVRVDAHRRASIAARLIGENMLDFVSGAIDAKSAPILKKHKVQLPDDAVPVAA